MKNITKLLLISICIFCFTISSNSALKAKTSDDLINHIVKKIDAKVKETGIRASMDVYSSESGQATALPEYKVESLCLAIMNKLFDDGNSPTEITVVNDYISYTVEFTKNNINGYIESRIYDNHNIITLDIKQTSEQQDFEQSKTNITKAFNDVIKKENEVKASKVKFNYYITAKLEADNIDMYYSLLLSILDEYGVSNINSINIERGYNLTGNSRLYEKIKSGGKWIDINIALSKYASGNYITIGTPTIYIQY